MKRKVAVVGSLLLVLACAAPSAAQEGHRDITLEPGKTLMEVKVPSQSLYAQLYPSYDFVEAVQRNGDGSVSTDVLVNPEEEAALRAQGVQFLRTLETDATTERRVEERDAALAREDRAQALAERGSGRSQSAIPQPGEVTIQRAYTFTNYAGRFVYVEAHNKAADARDQPGDGGRLRRPGRRLQAPAHHVDPARQHGRQRLHVPPPLDRAAR